MTGNELYNAAIEQGIIRATREDGTLKSWETALPQVRERYEACASYTATEQIFTGESLYNQLVADGQIRSAYPWHMISSLQLAYIYEGLARIITEAKG